MTSGRDPHPWHPWIAQRSPFLRGLQLWTSGLTASNVMWSLGVGDIKGALLFGLLSAGLLAFYLFDNKADG